MIELKYNVTVDIGDKSFKVTICEPTKKQKDELKECAKSYSKEFNKVRKKANKLNQKLGKLTDLYTLNKMLIEDGDKTIIRKQIELGDEISALQDEIEEWNENLEDTTTGEKETYELRFDLLVSGDDSNALKEFIEIQDINYALIFNEIAELTSKDGSKK